MTHESAENPPCGFWGHVLHPGQALHAQPLRRWEPLYRQLFASRWTLLFLLALGVARMLFFLAAYAPADGADGGDYYVYAAYIAGFDLPERAANVSPVFPIFVYLNHYVLGNFDLIIVWQLVMSSLLGVLMYWGLRRYNALLAFLVALVVLGDAQVGVVFNFAATEPLYIFMLVVAFALAAGTQVIPQRFLRWQDVLLGVLLALLRETRTVGAYLFVPFGALFALHTRDWQRILVLLASFGLMTLTFTGLTQTVEVAQTSTHNANMYVRPLIRDGLLDAANGENSARLVELRDGCQERPDDVTMQACLEAEVGDVNRVYDLYRLAYQEALRQQPDILLQSTVEAFFDFLRMSGHQYSGSPSPAQVQCEDIDARAQRQIDHFLGREWAALELTPQQLADFYAVTDDFMQQMCPPGWESEPIREIVNTISYRYRSLSRPTPVIWNGLLVALILILPWARRLWYPVFLAGGIWAYHAAISAAVQNVQPRYVVVTNPMKAVLVVTLLFLVAHLLLRVLDAWLASRDHQSNHPSRVLR